MTLTLLLCHRHSILGVDTRGGVWLLPRPVGDYSHQWEARVRQRGFQKHVDRRAHKRKSQHIIALLCGAWLEYQYSCV